MKQHGGGGRERWAAALFAIGYLILVPGLMVLNTTVLGLGDPKLGADGWKVYAPIWAIAFAPMAVSMLIVALRSRMTDARRAWLLTIALVVTLAAIETSFVVDAGLVTVMLAQLVMMGALVASAVVLTRRENAKHG